MRNLTVVSIAVGFLLCSYTNEARPRSKLHGEYWSQFKEAQDSSGVTSINRMKHARDQIKPKRDDFQDWGSNADADQNISSKRIICPNGPGRCQIYRSN